MSIDLVTEGEHLANLSPLKWLKYPTPYNTVECFPPLRAVKPRKVETPREISFKRELSSPGNVET